MKLPPIITGRAVRLVVMKRGTAGAPPSVLLRREVREETGLGHFKLLNLPPYVVAEPEPDAPTHMVLKVLLHGKLGKNSALATVAPDGQGVDFYPLDAATLAQTRPGVVRWLGGMAAAHLLPGQPGRQAAKVAPGATDAAHEAYINTYVHAYVAHYLPLALRAPYGWNAPHHQLGHS
jgi:hypothetical protein